MAPSISLLVFPSRLFPAHWALFIPSSSSPSTRTLLNARDTALSGFTIELERNYPLADALAHRLISLGEVDDKDLSDFGYGEGEDSVARNYVEEVALSVTAPEESLRNVSGGMEAPGKKVKIENFQTWLRNVVVKLVQKGVLGEEAISIVDITPKN